MNTSLFFSSAALLMSCASFFWSIHVGNRDKAKLKVKCQIYQASSFYKTMPGSNYLKVTAVNCGRRPVILTNIWKYHKNKKVIGHVLQNKRLDEHEKFEYDIDSFALFRVDEDGEMLEIVDLYLEDTLGRLCKVRDAKRNLKVIYNTQNKP